MSNVRQQKPRQNRFQRAYAAYAEQQNKALLANLLARPNLRPHLTLPTATGIGCAVLIHAVTLAVLIGGILLIVQNWPNVFFAFLGVLCLAIVWVLRPRLGKWPKKDVLPRSSYPTLYNLADQVANTLHLRPTDGIVISKDVNAGISVIGLSRKSLLVIGLPLWAILDDQEKVGLLAHEFAHRANGDIARGLVTGTAIHTLTEWFRLLFPASNVRFRYRGSMAVSNWVTKWMFFSLSLVPLAGLYIMRILFGQDSRRAEYLADYLAATVAGTDALVGIAQRVQMNTALTYLLRQVYTSGNYGKVDLFQKFRERVRAISEQDAARMQIDERKMIQSPNFTHPPLSYRLELLKARPITKPEITLSAEQSAKIDQELAGLRPRIQKQLLGQI